MTRKTSHSAFMVAMLMATLATTASADGLSEAERSAGFVSIFDGKTLDGAAHPGLKRNKGYIGLLGHTGRVEFRNLRIKE